MAASLPITPSRARLGDFDTCTQTPPRPLELSLNQGVLPTASLAPSFGLMGRGRGTAAQTVTGTSAAVATRASPSRAKLMTRRYTRLASAEINEPLHRESGSGDADQRVVAVAPGRRDGDPVARRLPDDRLCDRRLDRQLAFGQAGLSRADQPVGQLLARLLVAQRHGRAET